MEPDRFLLGLIILSSFIFTDVLTQNLHIVHSPEYLKFQPSKQSLQSGDVSKVISSALGVPSDSEFKWDGLLQGSFFKRPKANVLITIASHVDIGEEGLPGLKSDNKYKLEDDGSQVDIPLLTSHIQESFFNKNPLVLHLIKDNDLFNLETDSPLLKKVPKTLKKVVSRMTEADSVVNSHNVGCLNMSHTTDKCLMSELQMMKEVIKTVSDNHAMLQSTTPDLFSFTLNGFRDIVDKHGVKSEKTKDAASLINDVIDKATKDFSKLYKGNVLIEVVSTLPPEASLVRKVRSLKAAAEQDLGKLNLAASYSSDYPAVFNITLWLMVFFFVAVYVICYGIWNMDPGRDSIIYRMTSQRLKKD